MAILNYFDSLISWNKNPLTVEIEGKETQITRLFPPYFATPGVTTHQIPTDFVKAISRLEKIHEHLGKDNYQSIIEELKQLAANSIFTANILHHIQVIEEVYRNSYTKEDAESYIQWSYQLVLLELKGNASLLEEKVKSLYEKILNTRSYEIIKRGEKESNNPSYFLKDKETNQPFAILKLPLPVREFSSSFAPRHILDMPKGASAWQHDLMAFEQTQLFGSAGIPTTMAVEIKIENNLQGGVIQAYIPRALASNEVAYTENGAALIKSLKKMEAHRLAIETMILGHAAGHGGNFILQKSEDGQRLVKGYIIDGKETFVPINRVTPNMKLVRIDEIKKEIQTLKDELANLSSNSEEYSIKQQKIQVLEKQIDTVCKSLIMLRIFILGLPQNKETVDRALLLILTHPNFLSQIKAYGNKAKNYYNISREAIDAQIERVQGIQQRCVEELQGSTIQLTPRELFFHLFGGKHLYEIGKQKGYPDLLIFAHLISDPYQYSQKDFANNESIPVCDRLQKPMSDSSEHQHYFKNIRELEKISNI